VIDDATAWKRELGKVADRLEARTQQVRSTDRTSSLIERDFVLGAYALRKLVDTHSVSDQLRQRQFPVRRFELRAHPPDPLDPADITNSYDFEHGRRATLSVVGLCQEILNCFVFAFFCGETGDLFDGIYICADRHQGKYVYLVLASDFISLCADAGVD
jgi:hypothetical protein